MIVAFLTDILFFKVVVKVFYIRQPRFLKLLKVIKILIGEIAFLQQEVECIFWDAGLVRPDILKITINMRECLLLTTLCFPQFVQIAEGCEFLLKRE